MNFALLEEETPRAHADAGRPARAARQLREGPPEQDDGPGDQAGPRPAAATS
jgi:hypothetical protein